MPNPDPLPTPPDRRITIVRKHCVVCDQVNEVAVRTSQYAAWVAGALVQDVFPAFTPAEREEVMTGTHPECWDELFDDEED